MSFKNWKLISLWILITSLVSCSKDADINDSSDVGYDYFPVDVGSYLIYDIDSIVYNDFTNTVDTFKYQLKELIESEFVDNENRTSQRLERYYRPNDSAAWVLNNVWQSTRTSYRAEKVEENMKFVKLIFPVRDGLKWDGNAYNTEVEWKYVYQNTHKSDVVNGVSFDSTVTVLQKDEFNLIESKYYEERYAKHVGLIYKKADDLKTEINGNIKSGFRYTYKLKEFGKL